ncbi:MAG TPA: long-chain fatty acid--CoA ligase [Thermoanaerobaculia bacterium]
MQDFPLNLHHIVWRIEKLFARKEIATLRDSGMHRISYGEMALRARKLATVLQNLGVRQGDCVATLAWNNWRHLELYFAVPCIGGVLHTLNLRLSPEQLTFIANDAKDTVVFVDESLAPLLDRFVRDVPSIRRVVVLGDEYEQLIAGAEPLREWPAVDENAPMAMCYTSGTTGHPKGVVYSHRSQFLHAMGVSQSAALGLLESDVVLPIVPMFHANAWGLPYACGMIGASFVLPDRFMGDAEAMIQLAMNEGVTILSGVPTIWVGVAQKLAGRKLPKVRKVFCGGSAIPRALMKAMDGESLTMVQAWGMTETSPVATVALPRSWQDGDLLDIRTTQGPPVPCVELRICDLDSGVELPWDGVAFGEIQVRGPWVCSGYHNAADATRMTSDGWFRTGDVATVSPDGFVSIVDRAKDVIKSGGEWVSSVELENAIMAHPKVLEACVIGVPHEKWQERPVAYVVPRGEHRDSICADEILDHLSQHFMKWWLPDEVRFIDEVPKTSVGKFDKKVLRARAEPLAQADR